MMQWTAPHQRQRNVPIRDRYGHPESITLAFAERQVLAKPGRPGAADHDRFTPQSRHRTISRPESGVNLP
jgi:hypothetical protein